MPIKTEDLQHLVGCQVELQECIERRVNEFLDGLPPVLKRGDKEEIDNYFKFYQSFYRGEVTSISIEDNTLHISFRWLAKKEHLPNNKTQWTVSDIARFERKLEYPAPHIYHTGSAVFEWRDTGGKVVVFSERDGHYTQLDPSEVIGLNNPA